MLVGEFDHTIDEKNRLTLPARFRQAFAGGLVVTRGLDGCLYVFPRDEWEASVEARLSELDPLSKDGRLLQRYFYSGAAEADPDKQGRVMVPTAIPALGGLRRVVAVGGLRSL